MKNIFLLTLLLLPQSLIFTYGQQVDSVKLRCVENMKELSYSFSSTNFIEHKLLYKTNVKYVLPWKNFQKFDEKSFMEMTDTIIHNAELSVKTTFNKSNLALNSTFPVNIPDVKKVFTIRIVGSDIKDSLTRNLMLSEYPTISISEHKSYWISGDQRKENRWQTLYTFIPFDEEVKSKNLKGSVTFRAELLSDYQYVKITMQDIGKVYTINDERFKIVDIFKNNLVIAPMSGVDFKNDFKFVNVNSMDQEIAGLTIFEIKKLQEQDSTVSLYTNSENTSKMSKKVYEFFRNNSDLSYSNYSKVMHNSYMDLISAKPSEKDKKELALLGPKYTIFSSAGLIENVFIYLPVYKFKKEFKVSVK
jgi:hypothetical protein